MDDEGEDDWPCSSQVRIEELLEEEVRELRWIQAVSSSAAAKQWRWSIVGAVRRERSRPNEMLIMIDSGSDENCAPK